MNTLMLIIRFVLGMRAGFPDPTQDVPPDCVQRYGGCWPASGCAECLHGGYRSVGE